MRAAKQTIYGSPDVLTTGQVKRPSAADHELLVEVHASTVTQGDRRLRAADYPGMGAVLGRLMSGLVRPRHQVPGSVFAGRVVAVGKDVTRFAPGDDVFGSCFHGAQAEYLAVPDSGPVAKMPQGLGYGEAAAIPYGAITALVFLRDLAAVRPGERVLIVGASGGVGSMAVQLARHLGAHVTGVCGRDFDKVRDNGAHRVIDYRSEDFTKNGERYDVILDTHEGNRFRSCKDSLTPAGRYLSLYMSVGLLLQMGMTSLGRGPRAVCGVAIGDSRLMDDVRGLVEAGAFRPLIARRFPLEQIADAHSFLETERSWGSVLVDVVDPAAAIDVRSKAAASGPGALAGGGRPHYEHNLAH